MSIPAADPLNTIADSIVRRGLAVPAVFMLELHKPLSTVLSLGVLAAEPLLRLLFPADTVREVARVLESRTEVERLIRLVEERT